MKKLLLLPFVVGILLFPQVSYALIVNSGLTVEKVVSPSDKTGGVITLRGEESDETVRVYQTDYMFYADGRNEFSKPGSVPRSNASWIAYSPNQITVPAGGRAECHTRYPCLTTRTCAAPIGRHHGGLVPKGALEVPSAKRGSCRRHTDRIPIRRPGYYEYRRYGERGPWNLPIKGLRPKTAKHVWSCMSKTRANGGSCRKSTWICSARADSWADIRREAWIFPGCSVRYTVDLGALKRGKYSAMVIADAGEERSLARGIR